jgi:Ran GTPase-activating protein (RanGAP) involved in mRNA processing and transport
MTQFKNVKVLDLSGNNLDAKGAGMLATTISKSLNLLEALKLNGCQLGNKGVISVLESTRDKKHFNVLELEDCKMSEQGTTYLARYLTENRNVKEINLSNNKLDAKAIENIFKSLESNQKLEKVNISNNQLPSKAGIKLAALISACKNLIEVDASGNKFGSDVLPPLGSALRSNTSIQVINLSDNVMGHKLEPRTAKDGVAFLASQQTQLKTLILSNNSFDALLADEIAKALRDNSQLQKLVLASNPIARSGMLPDVWNTFLQSCSLKHLNISRCGINPAGFRNVLNMQMNELEELILDCNDAPSDSSAFATFFASCQLKKLSLKEVRMTDDVVAGAAAALGRNKILEELYLDDNQITHVGVENLMVGLKNNRYLRDLSLKGNRFDDSKAILKSVLEKTSLEKVIV